MENSHKVQRFNIKYVLSCSIMLNLFFVSLFMGRGGWDQLGWSRRARAGAGDGGAGDGDGDGDGAEDVNESLQCSGHGRAHLDGVIIGDHGKPVICECNACFGGPDCSQFFPWCTVDADSGNPLFLEPFWVQHAASSAIVVPGSYRMGYEYEDGSLSSKALEREIRRLHDVVGNAVTEGRYIIFGAGSTQLLNAAVHALSVPHSSSSSPAKVVASVPYYPVYKSQTELFESHKYNFNGDTSPWKNNLEQYSSTVNFIEFVTSPNNPDGQLKKAVLRGPTVKTIHDLAYYWPHYTPIPAQVDEDVMLFTLSKLTGHAGSRFGWAIVKDKAVYGRMLTYMELSTYGVPRETQLRALKLLKVVLEGKAREVFEFGYGTMSHRWQKLSKAFSESKHFSVQKRAPLYCTFSKIIRDPSPAFVWIKCERQQDEDCHAILLKSANITGRAGGAFGAESRYVRLSLVKSQDDFDLLLHRIEMLVFQERATTTWCHGLHNPTSDRGSGQEAVALSNTFLQ